MSVCKTSSFGENRSTLRRSSRLEENVLRKKLSLMQSMRRQSDSKFGLETKAVTKRLKNNLERSAQTDSRISIMKRSMAPSNRRHYKIKDHSTAEILKDSWDNDNSKAKISAMSCSVILPIALNVLEECGMEISKKVRIQLEDLQRAHRRYEKRSSRPTTSKKKRRKPLADCEAMVGSKSSMFSANTTASSAPIMSSYITTSDLEVDESLGVPHLIRPHTLQEFSSNLYTRKKSRPISAPVTYSDQSLYRQTGTALEDRSEVIDGMITAGDGNKFIYIDVSDDENPVTEFLRESIHEKTTDATFLHQNVADCCTCMSDSKCPLHLLHTKVHSSLESVTLVDVHKALVTTRKYSNRLEAFIGRIKKWKLKENEDDPHIDQGNSAQMSDAMYNKDVKVTR